MSGIHRRQLVTYVLFGVVIGGGGMKFAYEQRILTPSIKNSLIDNSLSEGSSSDKHASKQIPSDSPESIASESKTGWWVHAPIVGEAPSYTELVEPVGSGIERVKINEKVGTSSTNEMWWENDPVVGPANTSQPKYADNISTPAFDLSPPISIGDLCKLQEYLGLYGAYTGVVDGVNGPATELAVSLVQRKFGLEETGAATEDLLKQLESWVKQPNHENSVASYSLPSKPSNTETLYSTDRKRIAPLEIVTSPNSSDYLIKLENVRTRNEELSFFVRGHKSKSSLRGK